MALQGNDLMGEITTQRHNCRPCHGNGFISEPGDTCGICKGQGYIENESDCESVCPTCKGDGYMMARRSCNECNGKGFKVSIYETTDYVMPCIPCGGTGWIKEDQVYQDDYGTYVNQCQVICCVCHGRGIITDQRIKRIR